MSNRHALAALIEETRQVNGWSDQDIANRANSAGHKLSKQNISRVRNSDVVTLSIDFVTALAAGLGVPKSTVARASLASAGIVLGEEWTIEEAIQHDEQLSVREKKTLRLIVQAMRSEEHEDDTQKTDPPATLSGQTVKPRRNPAAGDRGRPDRGGWGLAAREDLDEN